MELDKTNPEKDCTYLNVAKHHGWFTATCQHETTTCFQHGFLPWHRVYVYEMEQAMRTIDPTISLPYWDFTSLHSPTNTTPVQDLLPSIVTERYYFNKDTNKTEFNPLFTYTIPSIDGADASPPNPGINVSRNTGDELGYLDFVRGLICNAFVLSHFDIFSRHYECPHNAMHVFQGGFIAEYTSSSQGWSSFDPLFWFFHTNIDRIWAGWEKSNDDFTSVFLSKTDTFYPFFDWTFEELVDYEATMYYTYDNTFTTDFCDETPQPGTKALFAHFTQLPVAHDKAYSVRLIVDPNGITGNKSANSLLTEDNIVSEVAMWRAMPSKCTSPTCRAWCPSLPVSSQKNVNLGNFPNFFSQPFDVSHAVFVDVYGKDQDPVDLSSGILANDLRTQLKTRLQTNAASLPDVKAPQLTYGNILSKQDYLNLAKVSADAMTALIDWHPISPLEAEYPPIKVAAGAELTFQYYVSDHSVAQVFENEFKQCGPNPIQPQCLPKPKQQGQVNCTIQLPETVTNTTYFFICTQSDHCGTRGMRIRVKVGDGANIPCSDHLTTDCDEPACPLHAHCRPKGAGKYPNGTVIIYSCEEDYRLEGYPSITCLPDGLWSSTPPQCVGVEDCAVRACPAHGICNPLAGTYVSNGTTIAYSCEEGYDVVGNNNSTCLGGAWTSDVPQCSNAMMMGVGTAFLIIMVLVSAIF